MPRRKSVNIIRDVGVDPKYGNQVIQKFINVVMWRGKKNTARRMVYGAFDIISKKIGSEKIVDLFTKAVENSTPLIEVKARRVGGSVYQVPQEVTGMRGKALAFRNIINAAKNSPGKDFSQRLSYALIEAAENRGDAVKAKIEKHKMAEANRAFSHLVW